MKIDEKNIISLSLLIANSGIVGSVDHSIIPQIEHSEIAEHLPAHKYSNNQSSALKIKRKVAKTQRMENEISYKIIGAAIKVHRVLGGPGLLEGIYESCLCHELALSGFKVER